MNVLMISPGYPTEINYFTRGLAVQGARVFGIGDQPERDLPDMVRQHLAGYVQASSLLDEAAVVKQVRQWKAAQPLRQVDASQALQAPLQAVRRQVTAPTRL